MSNEEDQLKVGDYVMILQDNYSVNKHFRSGDICRICGELDGIFFIDHLYDIDNDYAISEDLGFYSWRKIDSYLLKLLEL